MITIHCGLHKTGSSSIQLALESCSHKGRLIITPRPGDDRSEAGWKRRFSSLAPVQSAVLSDENILGSPFDGYRLAPERISMIRETMLGSRYQIVVYLRPHVDWLPSVYLQGVQQGMTAGPEEFWASLIAEPYLKWSTLMELLQRESGAERVIARAHTRSRDAVGDFFALVGLGSPPRTGKMGIRENVSIAAVQAPLLRELNSLPGVDDEQRRQFRTVFQRELASGAERNLSPFPAAIQQEVAQKFHPDWTELSMSQIEAEEKHVFLLEVYRYQKKPDPYAGSSWGAPFIARETLRSMRVLLLATPLRDRTVLSRLMKKMREDPLSLPNAARRRVSAWLR